MVSDIALDVAEHSAPAWWRDAKFGIMITWGLYSVPAYAPPVATFQGYAEWYWFFQQVEAAEYAARFPAEPVPVHGDVHRERFGGAMDYDDLFESWRAESWDPDDWVDAVQEAGAGYVVLVAKHHDGVALWPTATSERHTGVLGPRRDIVGEVLAAARDTPLRAGVFYAMAEWFTPAPLRGDLADPAHPLFDLAFNQVRSARDAVTGAPRHYRGYRPVGDYVADHVVPQLTELIDRYRPSLLWFDLPADPRIVDAAAIARHFYRVAGAAHPDGVLLNDQAVRGGRGDFRVVDAVPEHPAAEPFEVCRSIGVSFGHNAEEPAVGRARAGEIVSDLVAAVCAGGNLLLNVGPRADGTISDADRACLREIGAWLDAHGRAIFATRVWTDAPSGVVGFTLDADDGLYAFVPVVDDVPTQIPVVLEPGTRVVRVADGVEVVWSATPSGTAIGAGHPPDVLAGTPLVLRLGHAEQVSGVPQ